MKRNSVKMSSVQEVSQTSNDRNNITEAIEPEILYEFLTYAEWPQEPELMVKGYSVDRVDEGSNKKAASFAKTALWSIFSSLTGYIPAEISKLINNRLSWQFVVGGNGKVVAILQEGCIEIRSFKDDYSTIVGKCYVAKDAFPQWRTLAWSPDCSILALSYSNGSVDCFDVSGSKLFTIETLSTATNDLSDALVAILFVDSRVKKTQWFFEIILINFKGVLRSCFVSPTDGFQDYHSFSLMKYFSQGVTSAVYNPKFNTIICSGTINSSCSSNNENQSYLANQYGIVTWRLLSDFPYYKITQSLEEEKLTHKKLSTKLLRIPSFILYRNEKPDTVFKVCLSLENTALVAVHVSGALSLWDVPSLRLRKIWPLNEQPDYNAENQSNSFPSRKKKLQIMNDPLKHHLVDVNWWSEKAIILARYSGSVAVSSVNNLSNLLGNSLEWFESQPLVSAAYDKGFLILECESVIATKRRSVSPDFFDDESLIEDAEDSSDDDNDGSVIQKTSTFVKTALYYITDSEKFQPPRKKPKIVNKTFRLICLKSTTPEELFARKLDNEVYGEAIELAKAYGLDCDLVYQRQWRNSKVSLPTIQDYLSKITKRSWVLHECLERTPEDIEATRALLNYGLQGTDLETLISIGNGTDDGIFTVSDSQSGYDDINGQDGVTPTPKEVNECKARADLLAQVDFSKLTVEQQNLCLTRQKLLKYIDRLATYEVMLGGPMIADEYFDCNFFNKFRAQPAVEAALDFAHESNWQFVAAMFTYHGDEILSHRLPILSNFPETLSPFEYRSLLPECGYDKKQVVYPWDQEILREQDWVESNACRKIINRNWTASPTYLYECGPELEKYRCTKITPKLLTAWYIERAAEIERCSRLVNNSLELITLGMERNVQGLEKMRDDLLTMEVLVYECYADESITLDCFQTMKDREKIHLLMSTSSEENYVKNVRRWLIPFLSRCEKYAPGSWKGLMRDYLLSLAKYDLSLCVKIFQNSREEQEHPILSEASELISLAMDCIYSCQEETQLNQAFSILECLPQSGYGPQTDEMRELHDKLDELEKHLRAAEILEKHGINKTVAYIRNCQQDPNEVKQLLTLLTRVASRKDPPPDEPQWKQLLEDVLELQSDAFQCIEKSKCAEIFAESLLCSGKKENIYLASGLFKCCAKTTGHSGNKISSLSLTLPVEHSIPDDRASHLVIAAAKEYFNSSSYLKDPSMEHAKQCLKLIPVPDESVLAELDLIDSLSILNSFEVNILPLQVRMCRNRLNLIEQIFKSKPDAYRESQKLMTLAHFLRVGQDVREWEEGIYILVASAALQARDFHACYNACESLISQKYSKGWEVCLALGQCELFKDINARQYLLAFAEIYCSDDTLGEVLETMHILERQVLHQKLETHFEMAKAQRVAPAEESEQLTQNENLFEKATFSANIQQFTTEATKQVLATVGNAEFWKQTTSWMKPHWRTKETIDSDTSFNSDFNKLAIPEFFTSLLPHSLASPLMPKYDSYAVPQEIDSSLSVCLILFQLAIYEGRWDKNDFLHTVLHQATVKLLPVDSVLGLMYMLALEEPTLIDNCIQQLPNSDVCLHLAIYCCALQICQSAELVNKEKLYASDPASVVKKAIRYAQTRSTACDKIIRKYCDLLQVYEKRRADFAQGRLLQSLGRGVDVARFSLDDQYKQETVLGLVMTIEEKTYNTAITLARKYNVPLWDVYMSHLEYLFSEEEISTPSIERRVVDLDLLSVLMKDLAKFKDRLMNTIYATISGHDHARLLYYFSLLNQCAPKDKDYQAHTTLLRKLKPVAEGLDYKAIVSGMHDVLKLISPVLTVSNVQVFSKLSTQLSKCCKQPLDASMIYRIWLLKLFFERVKTDANPLSHQEWISQYNLCKDYFDKLNPSDLVAFIEGALFIDIALDEITSTTRKELLNRTLKFTKQEMRKCKEDSIQRIKWQETLEYFEKALKHLEWMQCDHINELRQLDNDGHQKRFLRAVELSLSHPDKVKSLLFECVMDGHPLELLQQLISICPPEIAFPPGDVIMETVKLILMKLRDEEVAHVDLFQNRDCIKMLNTIVDTVINHNANGGDLVDLNDIAGELHQLCTDNHVEIPVKLNILSLLEKIYPEDSEELQNLSTYKVGAFLASGWPSLQITQEDMENDEMKEQLFNKLLALCDNLERASTLTKLLLCWPTLPSKYNNNFEENSWCKIICLMLQIEDQNRLDSVVNVVRITEAKSKLSLQCLEPALMEVMKRDSWQHSLKFALLTTYDRLYSIVIEATAKLDKEYVLNVDDEVCLLLIQKKLTSIAVPTVLYKPLLNYILNNLPFGTIKEIAADLRENGYYCEAASLLCTGSNIPASLTTFNSAVGLIKRWL